MMIMDGDPKWVAMTCAGSAVMSFYRENAKVDGGFYDER
jgi:hypothetical protein